MPEDPWTAPLCRARTGGARPARVHDLTQRTVAFVLAGGRGTRLRQLTDKLDYSVMLAEHVASGADVTVACVDVPLADAVNFGVMAVDAQGRVVDFRKKPARPAPMPGKDDRALASKGIYAFGTKFLCAELERDAREPASSHDFGKDMIPGLIMRGARVMAHHFATFLSHRTRHRPDHTRDARSTQLKIRMFIAFPGPSFPCSVRTGSSQHYLH